MYVHTIRQTLTTKSPGLFQTRGLAGLNWIKPLDGGGDKALDSFVWEGYKFASAISVGG